MAAHRFLPLIALWVPLALWAEPHWHVVQTVPLVPQTSFEAQRSFSGRVEAAQRVELGFELAGRIDAMAVVEGMSVEAGQLLASLDTRLLQAESRELLARSAELEARRDQVVLELARQRRLIDRGHAAQQRVDDLDAERRALDAQLQRLQAQQDGVQLRLDKSRLHAPFAGEVLSLTAEQGMVVQAGQPLLRLVQTQRSEAVFGVPASLGAGVVVGDELEVLGEFGQACGRVLSVSRSVDPATLTRTVRVALPPSLGVADSSVVQALLTERRPLAGAWLPLDALLAGPRGTWAVYVLNPAPGLAPESALAGQKPELFHLSKHSVEVLHQRADAVYVRSALDAGAAVVAGGTHRLAPGQTVRLP